MAEPTIMLTGGVIGLLLFVFGLIVGVGLGRRNTEEGNIDQYSDTVTLWRNVIFRIDDLIRRNVISLGSIRERLFEIDQSLVDPRVVNTIDDLVKDNSSLEREVHKLHLNLEAWRSDNQAESQMGLPLAHPKEEFSKSHQVNEIGDFLSEITNIAQEDTLLVDLLDRVYDGLGQFIPYQRMGYAEVDQFSDKVSAVWSRSEKPVRLKTGYSATLSNSSLQFVAKQNRPRLLNNLPEYLLKHPNSTSTRLIVEEGFRSSLACPVTVEERVVGFLFLTSVAIDNFNAEHVALTKRVTAQIGQAVCFTKQLVMA